MGVNSLPKTVTRQRRGCDLNPLTTRLASHPIYTVRAAYTSLRWCLRMHCAVHAVADQVADAKSELADNAVKFPNS